MFKKIVTVLLFLSLTLNGYFLLSKSKEMTVVEAHDGDTFTIKNGDRVRLLGINAPEIGNCGSTESANLLKSLVLNKVVKITEEKRDAFGRRMGLVWAENKLVNKEMLKTGFR